MQADSRSSPSPSLPLSLLSLFWWFSGDTKSLRPAPSQLCPGWSISSISHSRHAPYARVILSRPLVGNNPLTTYILHLTISVHLANQASQTQTFVIRGRPYSAITPAWLDVPDALSPTFAASSIPLRQFTVIRHHPSAIALHCAQAPPIWHHRTHFQYSHTATSLLIFLFQFSHTSLFYLLRRPDYAIHPSSSSSYSLSCLPCPCHH